MSECIQYIQQASLLYLTLFVSHRCDLSPLHKEETFFILSSHCSAWLGGVKKKTKTSVTHTTYTPTEIMASCWRFTKDFLSTLIFSLPSEIKRDYLCLSLTDPHQSNNTGSHRLVICQYSVGTWNTDKKNKKQPHQEYLLPQDLVAFQDPVCSSSRQILGGNRMKTFIRPSPFIMQLQPLNEHFAGYNMGVIIVLQEKETERERERERCGSFQRIMPKIWWALGWRDDKMVNLWSGT